MQIKSLEAEQKKQDSLNKMMKNGEEVKTTESYLQMVRNHSLFDAMVSLCSFQVCEHSKSTTV